MALVLAVTFFWIEKQDPADEKGAFIDISRIRALLKLGAPASAQILLEIGAFAAATALCAKLGPIQLSGHEIALNCASFAFMVPLGISSAAAVRVGQNLGREHAIGARRAGWSAILLGAGFMTCCGLIFLAIPAQLARIFSPDPQVIRIGAMLLRVAAAFQLFDGLQVVTTGALRGAGDTRTPMIANFVAYWLVGLPLSYVLAFPLDWGSFGIWIGLCCGLMLIGSALLITWHKKHLAAYGNR
jgi:MATE family multidrug resistance protein